MSKKYRNPDDERRAAYASIVESHLKARGARANDFDEFKVLQAPRYVVRMAMALGAAIRKAGSDKVTTEDVLRYEKMAAGHTDYHLKLARYCLELELKGK